MNRAIVWLAQGCGLGRLPKAPGTWGSLGGLVWTALLYWPGSFWFYTVGTVVGLCAAVWICGEAERAMNQSDPPSVVLDEIAAVPVCFLFLLAAESVVRPVLPTLGELVAKPAAWCWLLAGFGLFRLFDVTKPLVVDQAQSLSGGWGVVMDDVVAAIYAAVALQLLAVLLR
ncbi:MAG: phosphatidylglycerophosphatase A [Pedosphaera sp.]|nr:phosphatidylglycerophosphatase A [Pedosphaera sp.]MSU42618.1 phosphatidylglycerophosphatase A [Pedosphaera sp.]